MMGKRKHALVANGGGEVCEINSPSLLAVGEDSRSEHLVSAMHKKLDSLKTLREGWDGFSAAPISQAVINNVKTALDYCTDDDLKGWRALPEINGTILLQNDGLRSGIHIGNNEFSYFAIHNDTVSGDDNIAFVIPQFLHVLRSINK